MEKLKKIWRTAKLFLLGLLVGALLTAVFLAPPLMRWIGENTGPARSDPAPDVSGPRPVFVRVAGAAAGAGVSADGRTWVAPAAGEAELTLVPGAYELRAALSNKTVFAAWTLYQTGADTQAPVLDLSLAPECPEFIILEKNYGENASLPLPLSGAATVTLEKTAPGLSVRADADGLFRLEAGPAVRPGFYHAVLTARSDGGETVAHAGLRVRAAGAVTEITGADGLRAMAYNLSGHFRLTEDIDLSAIPWQSVGTEEYPFTGIFEGGGHEIRGLSAPLFGVVQSAEISGFVLRDPAVAETETAAALAVVARDSFIHDAAVLGGGVRAAAAAGCVYRAEGSVLSGLVNSAAVEAEA
ncbi:MAG: hypothetical protein LBL37_08920, partial [Gracilibacteraceae bacterium]|nr:hypothetical protein [Gracilibacteraceae bacterium]